MYKNIKNQCKKLYLNTNYIKENQKTIFFCDILVAFFYKNWNAMKNRDARNTPNITNPKYKIIFSAFLITENLKNSRFMKTSNFHDNFIIFFVVLKVLFATKLTI